MDWDAKRQMSADDFLRTLGALGWSYSKMARFLGVSARTVSRYAEGSHPVPTSIALLLHVMLEHSLRPTPPRKNPRVQPQGKPQG